MKGKKVSRIICRVGNLLFCSLLFLLKLLIFKSNREQFALATLLKENPWANFSCSSLKKSNCVSFFTFCCPSAWAEQQCLLPTCVSLLTVSDTHLCEFGNSEWCPPMWAYLQCLMPTYVSLFTVSDAHLCELVNCIWCPPMWTCQLYLMPTYVSLLTVSDAHLC